MVYKIQQNCASSNQRQEEEEENILESVPVEIKQEEELIIEDIDGSQIRWCFISGLDDNDAGEDQEFCSEINTGEAAAAAISSLSQYYGRQQMLPLPSLGGSLNVSTEDVIEITDDEQEDDFDTTTAVNGNLVMTGGDEGEIDVINEPIQEISFCHGIDAETTTTNEKDDKNDDDTQTENEESINDTKEFLEETSVNSTSPITRRHRRNQQEATNDSTNNEECLSVSALKEMLARKYMKIQCHICNEILAGNTYTWLRHVRDIHQDFFSKMLSIFSFHTDVLASCKLCKVKINYKVNHLYHYVLKHTEVIPKLFLCSVCDYADSSVFDLQKHQKEQHVAEEKKAVQQECPKCQEGFKNSACVEFHFLSSHRHEFWAKFRYNCHLCIKPPAIQHRFEGKRKTYYEHLINEHKINNWKMIKFRPFDNDLYWQCTQCFKLFTGTEDFQKLLTHWLSHEENCFWSCKYCESIHRFQEFPALHMCNNMKEFYRLKNKKDDTQEEDNKAAIQKLISWEEFEFYVKHVCPFCKDEFEKFDDWRQHIRETHHINTLEGLNMCIVPEDPEKLQCLECFAQIPKIPVELHKHRFEHLPFLPYKCRHCPKYLGTYKLALTHVLHSCDDEEKSLPPTTTKTTTSNDNTDKSANVLQIYSLKLQNDSVSPDSLVLFSCQLCRKRFSSNEDIMLHSRSVHNNFQQYFTKVPSQEGKSICKICRNVVNGNAHCLVHYFAHLDEKPYKCRKCCRSFTMYKRAKEHVINYHSSSLVASTEKNPKSTVKQEKEMKGIMDMQIKSSIKKENEGDPKSAIKNEKEVETPSNAKSRKSLKKAKETEAEAAIKFQKAISKKKDYKTTANSTDTQTTKLRNIIKEEKEAPEVRAEIEKKTIKKEKVPEKCEQIKAAADLESETPFLDTSAKNFKEFGPFIKYACPECNAPCPNLDSWEQHVQEQHAFFHVDQISVLDAKKGTHKCKDCHRLLPDQLSRRRKHKLTHLSHNSFICSLCHARCAQIDALYAHLKSIHFEQVTRKCPLCPKSVNSLYELSVHMKASHSRKQWPKDLCSICFNTFLDMESHKRKVHTIRPKTDCPICGISFAKGLEQHMATTHKKRAKQAINAKKSAAKRKSTTEANNAAKKQCLATKTTNTGRNPK